MRHGQSAFGRLGLKGGIILLHFVFHKRPVTRSAHHGKALNRPRGDLLRDVSVLIARHAHQLAGRLIFGRPDLTLPPCSSIGRPRSLAAWLDFVDGVETHQCLR